ncbi:hypothetical protein GCM10009093_12570 [Brevundimonas terrae]|uniref:Uncharacterized protein n=1 Tax=Brevundimonas terrae TaxID=363631 RepID=A0ABN0Y8R5_9CAUL|nr:hypothetical protein [Brevundimonas terrae]
MVPVLMLCALQKESQIAKDVASAVQTARAPRPALALAGAFRGYDPRSGEYTGENV